MQQVQDYYAIYGHCQQCAGYYADKYERPQPAQQAPVDDGDYDE